MPGTALFWPLSTARPRCMIPTSCNIARSSVAIPINRSKSSMPTRATPVWPTETSSQTTKSSMASCEKTLPPPSSQSGKSSATRRSLKCAILPAQLNRVPCGKFNRVKTVFWHQSSSRQSQAGTVYKHHEEQPGCLV